MNVYVGLCKHSKKFTNFPNPAAFHMELLSLQTCLNVEDNLLFWGVNFSLEKFDLFARKYSNSLLISSLKI